MKAVLCRRGQSEQGSGLPHTGQAMRVIHGMLPQQSRHNPSGKGLLYASDCCGILRNARAQIRHVIGAGERSAAAL
ncbi:hypothetical protein KZ483_03510 [Paenibacillus sp. sptzw28]|uniref:hypothetical protein n=1 Tax=Paenibacillus sp. sptzw28 TaxID=715179 RepID=UPI001C6E3677|nr:hypothetical protein [Paenibacillus sp. sptzw28]QYR22103.1 hypothetical protein KZ483_03510 [Paenibacillus sp. sptzw28]